MSPKLRPVQGEITPQAVVPLHVIDTTTGTGEEHDIRVNPVNIEIVAVETFPGPQGGALKWPSERRQVTQFDKGLTNVQIAGACSPVVIRGLPVGDHHLKAGRGPIIQGLLMFKIHFNIGILAWFPRRPIAPPVSPAGVM